MWQDAIIYILVSFVGGGAVCAALIKGVFEKKKVKADSASTLIDSAIQLSEASAKRYASISEHLELSEKHLAEARKQLIYERNYNAILEAELLKNGVPIPDRPQIE